MWSFFRFSAILILIANSAVQAGTNGVGTSQPTSPRYELSLSFPEFAILHNAVQSGVTKYGGGAELDVRLVKFDEGVTWLVTIRNSELMEAMDYWLSERISVLTESVNFNASLDDEVRTLLETAKGTHAKFRAARANPIWDTTTMRGVLNEADSTWTLSSGNDSLRLDVSRLKDRPTDLDGKDVVASGVVRSAGKLDATRLVERRPDTLELFVMSQCPYGQAAERSTIGALMEADSAHRPKLEVHYLFYKKSGSTDEYTSLHGSSEVDENVIQICIRDQHPEYYWDYLLLRSQRSDGWKILCREVGASQDEITELEFMARNERDTLIRREYDYAARRNNILDNSPTVVWEGDVLASLAEVPFMHDVKEGAGSCSGPAR